jgi:CHAT domain
LSGLARAFFYAGARALLVSHWADATVKLITGAVERIASDKRIGRAEAMRQSMLALIDKEAVYEAHPAFWAPFAVVGEGAEPGKRKFRYRQAEAESSCTRRVRPLRGRSRRRADGAWPQWFKSRRSSMCVMCQCAKSLTRYPAAKTLAPTLPRRSATPPSDPCLGPTRRRLDFRAVAQLTASAIGAS